MQCRPTAFLARIYVPSVLQQRAYGFLAPSRGGCVQWRVLRRISSSRPNVGSLLNQSFYYARLPEEASQMQRRPAVIAVSFHQFGTLPDQLKRSFFRTCHAGREHVQLHALFKQQRRKVVPSGISGGDVSSQALL